MVSVRAEEVAQLSEDYGIPETEIFLIGLNILGIDTKIDTRPDITRTRFTMRPEGEIEPSYFALTIDRESPYKHSLDGQVRIGNELVGRAGDLEEDTCADTYFRMDGRAMTLNSNSRSNCEGCQFCGTYSLESEESDLTLPGNLESKIESLMGEEGISNLKDLDNVGVVTGCFADEGEAVDHLLMVKNVLSKYDFDGEIKYVGSQVRSREAIDRLASEGNYAIYLTVECFERRDQMMKPTKASLGIEEGREVLRYAKDKGLETSFLYILGLDSIDSIKKEFPKYTEVLTRHPIVNLMQNYVPGHNNLRNPEAQELEYYLKARKEIEEVFADTDLRPRLWENYRSPWLNTYAGDKIDGPKI